MRLVLFVVLLFFSNFSQASNFQLQAHNASTFKNINDLFMTKYYTGLFDDQGLKTWGNRSSSFDLAGKHYFDYNLTRISAHLLGFCGIDQDKVVCLGDISWQSPQPVVDGVLVYTQFNQPRLVATDEETFCVADAAGLHCQFDATPISLPADIQNATDITEIAIANWSICVIQGGTRLRCFADDGKEYAPVSETFQNAKELTMGNEEVCLIDRPRVICYALFHSKLKMEPDGHLPSYNDPIDVALTKQRASHGICILQGDGAIRCTEGGDGYLPKQTPPSPARRLRAGHTHICAFSEGFLKCWGNPNDIDNPDILNYPTAE